MGGCSHVLSSWAGGKVTFREFLSVLGTRWRIIALSLLAVVAAAAIQTMLTPATYTASTKIYLSAKEPSSRGGTEKPTYAVNASDLAAFLDVLTAPAVSEPLRARLGLPPDAPLGVTTRIRPDWLRRGSPRRWPCPSRRRSSPASPASGDGPRGR